MKMIARVIFVLVALIGLASAFMGVQTRVARFSALRMSDAADPLSAIRAKMASDPNYDPLKDPQAMQQLEALIPQEMREFANAIERLKVGFTDATTGTDAVSVEDINSRLGDIAKKTPVSELISSPQSEWFKSGAATPTDFEEGKLKRLAEDARKEHPEVPLN